MSPAMKLPNRAASLILTAAALLGGILVSSPSANAAPITTHGRYCMTVVDRIAGSAETKVVDRICSDQRRPGTYLPMTAGRASTVALLVTFFENTDYQGRWETIGGRYGTCDKDGYYFSNLSLANFNVAGISSYRLNGACRYANYWNKPNFVGDRRSLYGQNIRYVGASWNDRLLSMKLRA